ncbi:MAG: hypothetical protein ACI39C_07445 [Dietzia sp.]
MAAKKDNEKPSNVIQYETEDGRTAFGARDSRGAVDAADRKAKTSDKPAEKESTAAVKA